MHNTNGWNGWRVWTRWGVLVLALSVTLVLSTGCATSPAKDPAAQKSASLAGDDAARAHPGDHASQNSALKNQALMDQALKSRAAARAALNYPSDERYQEAEQALQKQSQASSRRALACWTGLECIADPPPEAPSWASSFLTLRPRNARERRLVSQLARSLLEPFNNRASAHSFISEEEQGLLASSFRAVREGAWARVLLAAKEREQQRQTAQTDVSRLASSLKLSNTELLAARVGMTPAQVSTLAGSVLRGSAPTNIGHPNKAFIIWAQEQEAVEPAHAFVGPWLFSETAWPYTERKGSTASELAAPLAACFIVDAPTEIQVTTGGSMTPTRILAERYARGVAVAAGLTEKGALHDEIFARAVGNAVRISSPRARSSHQDAVTLRLRFAAASVLGLWASFEQDHAQSVVAANRAASRAIGHEKIVEHGGLLLDVDPSGRIVDELVVLVLAAALLKIVRADLGQGWAKRKEAKRRGHELLVEQWTIWQAEGLKGLLRRAGVENAGDLSAAGR